MQERLRQLTAITGFVLAATFTAAAQEHARAIQVRPGDAPHPPTVVSTAVQPMRVPFETRTVKGAPYTAEIESESVQVLGDGNRIVNRTTGRVYRDSEGRTRREEDHEPGRVSNIAISDPVTGHAYSLDTETRTAWRTTGPRVVQLRRSDAPAGAASRGGRREAVAASPVTVLPAPATRADLWVGSLRSPLQHVPFNESSEVLAPRNIGGVMAEGTRITRTIPAGAIGNEQPIVSVTEEWTSPELQVLVLTRTSDPRTGEYTYRLLNIVRAEPSPSLFDLPADYSLKSTPVREVFVPAVREQP